MLYDPNWKSKDPVVKRTDLTERELRTLLRVREGLLSGAITPTQFRMDTLLETKTACGTMGCIAGWMSYFAMVEDDVVPNTDYFGANAVYFKHYFQERKFKQLFAPFTDQHGHGFDYANDEATPEMGIRAIDNFLAGDAYPWHNVEIPCGQSRVR